MKRIDNAASELYWKMAITGPGGTGKTSMGVSAPRPLILLSERQGMPSIRQAAKRLGVPMPAVLLVEEAEDYRCALRALHGPKDKPFKVLDKAGAVVMELPEWPLTVVLDSLTDACDVMIRQIRTESPPRVAKDGLPKDATRFWGVLIDRCMAMIKAFRDLPMNVVFLCLLRDSTKEDEDGNILERVITPKLATKDMAQGLCAAVNVMGYTYRTNDKEKGLVYGVMTQGPEGMLTKPCEPLRRFEVPNLTNWVSRLNGNLEDVPGAPPAPELGQSFEHPPEVKQPIHNDGPDTDSGSEAPGTDDPEPGERCGCGAPVLVAGDLCQDCEASELPPVEIPDQKASKPRRSR